MGRAYNETMMNALKLVGGSIVGAGLGLLFAPSSGKKTRRDITRFARKVGRKTDRMAHEFAGNVTDFAGFVGAKAGGIMHSGK